MSEKPTTSPWGMLRRIEEQSGEARANLIRLLAIVAFYGNHVVQTFITPPSDGPYHLNVSFVAMLWFMSVIAVFARIRMEKPIPDWFRYLMSIWDIALITMLLILRETPQNALICLYFIVIAMAALRWNIRLIQATTAAAIFGYLSALSYHVVAEVGVEKYYSTPEIQIPRSEEIIVVLSLIACGGISGQVIRQIRRALLNVEF